MEEPKKNSKKKIFIHCNGRIQYRGERKINDKVRERGITTVLLPRVLLFSATIIHGEWRFSKLLLQILQAYCDIVKRFSEIKIKLFCSFL